MSKYKIYFFVFIMGLCLVNITLAEVTSKEETNFPRLIAVFEPARLNLISDNIDLLSKFDMLMMSMNMGQLFPEQLKEIKKRNSDVKFLVYVNSSAAPRQSKTKTESLSNMFHAGIKDGWWLRDSDGNIQPGLGGGGERVGALNVTNLCPLVNNQRWNTYIIDFLKDNILSTGLWDGVMFDVVKDGIVVPSPKGKMQAGRKRGPARQDKPKRQSGKEFDLDNDGIADDGDWVNQKWQEGYRTMFTYARKKFGKDILLVANGNHTQYDYCNGKVFENFPHFIHTTKGDWLETMKLYHLWLTKAQSPKVVIFDIWAEPEDYRSLRLGLTSALMDDGYFSYESGEKEGKQQGQILWYDEYDNAGKGRGYLGKAINSAKEIMPKIFRRDFEKGIVLTNMSDKEIIIKLETEFRKIKGSQDPKVNDGSLIKEITLPAQDGIILLNTKSH